MTDRVERAKALARQSEANLRLARECAAYTQETERMARENFRNVAPWRLARWWPTYREVKRRIAWQNDRIAEVNERIARTNKELDRQ